MQLYCIRMCRQCSSLCLSRSSLCLSRSHFLPLLPYTHATSIYPLSSPSPSPSPPLLSPPILGMPESTLAAVAMSTSWRRSRQPWDYWLSLPLPSASDTRYADTASLLLILFNTVCCDWRQNDIHKRISEFSTVKYLVSYPQLQAFPRPWKIMPAWFWA